MEDLDPSEYAERVPGENDLTPIPSDRRPVGSQFEDILTGWPIPSLLVDPVPPHKILLFSNSFIKYFGVSSYDCQGMNVSDLFNVFRLYPGADEVNSVIAKSLELKNLYLTNDVRGDDHSFWTVRSTPIYKAQRAIYIFLSLQESTEDQVIRQSANELMDTEDTFRALVNAVQDYAIFSLDTGGFVKNWNAGAELLKGYKAEEIIGRHFSIFYKEEDRAKKRPEKELAAALKNGRVEDEGERCRKDGSLFQANVVITPIFREGRHIGFAKITRDLTERNAVEKNLIDSYKKNRVLQDVFVANMSHEIKTPLNGLALSIDFLLESMLTLTPAQQGHVAIIRQSKDNLLAIVNDILEMSQLDSNSFTLNSVPTSVHNITNEVINSFKENIPPRITLTVDFADELPTAVELDGLRFKQVLKIMLSNAVKFTEKGSVSVLVCVEKEEGRSYMLKVEVADTGIGIDEKDVSRLFKRFGQLDASATKKYKGTGMGLSIAKGFVELMGGRVSYRPNTNIVGSIFGFTVDAQKVTGSTPISELADHFDFACSTTSPSSQSATPIDQLKLIAPTKRLLLVEDNEINKKIQLKLLKNLGFVNTDVRENGADALQTVKENRLKYNCVLMDIQMPIMDGLTATVEIRRLKIKVPIIAMTANSLQGDVEEYLKGGMDACVGKPINKALLVSTLLAWLDKEHEGKQP